MKKIAVSGVDGSFRRPVVTRGTNIVSFERDRDGNVTLVYACASDETLNKNLRDVLYVPYVNLLEDSEIDAIVDLFFDASQEGICPKFGKLLFLTLITVIILMMLSG